MTWIKLDDNAVDHPKVASLTDRAFRWWVKGLSYASRLLTDGLLPPTFWKPVPKQTRSELTGAKLWDWDDPNFRIHDYLSHQSSRDAVTQKRADNADRVTRYREKKRNALQPRDSNAPVTEPETENREQRQRTETETTPSASVRGVGLIVSPAEFFKLQQTHAFVGAKLRVPNVLHAELMTKSGANADVELRDWYARLDEELESHGKGTGDVFAWLRPRHQAFAVSKGWIDPVPKVTQIRENVTPPESAAVTQAMETRRRRAEMQAKGMSDDEIEAVFEREYQERRNAS